MLRYDRNALQLNLFEPEIMYADTPIMQWLQKQEKEKSWLDDAPFSEDQILGKQTFPDSVYYYYVCEDTPMEQKQKLLESLQSAVKRQFEEFSKDAFGRVLRVGREFKLEPSNAAVLVYLNPDIRKRIGLLDFPEDTVYYSIDVDSIATVYLKPDNKKAIIRYVLWDHDIKLDDGVTVPKHPTAGITFTPEF